MRFLRDNGLTLALLGIFILSAFGMLFSGWANENKELAEHGREAIGVAEFFFSGTFQSALFENWESEFLQMASYVVFTAYLFQRGSAESQDPDNPEGDDSPKSSPNPFVNFVVEYSLGLVLMGLFLLSFILHWLNSLRANNEEALLHGVPPDSAFQYLIGPQFWFESFQNWQSEFLSTAVLVVLSIFLRYRGSPESKRVDAPNEQTGA